ncbi:caspase family protein [Streptomyces sp. NPDC056486]|uniref:caspase family protein n=1 Tax=Streptomyces sp. NPDC056486 TaxID=3345835 RepID=UPI0036785CE4
MRQRALLIGSQTGVLRGVHADVELMAGSLSSFGFETTCVMEGGATRQGIIEACRGLIEDTVSGDAAVVYYSGHGGRARNPLPDRDGPDWLQFLCPTDIGSAPPGEFRGLLADELSLLQQQLSERTTNVTTIVDCCHAARMARDEGQVPKADPRVDASIWEAAHGVWQAARAAPNRLPAAESNPSVVRLVACAPEASAYEIDVPDIGGVHGLLTATLVRILRRPGSARLTWRGLIGMLRPAVLDVVPFQRPEVEGPADRRLFDGFEERATGVLPVLVGRGAAFLEGAELFGIGIGDTYAVVAADGDATAPLATAVVDQVAAGRARLRLDASSLAALPAGAEAHPLEVGLARRPVAVRPPNHVARDTVAEALGSSPHLRVVESEGPTMATVALDDGLCLLDAQGEPLWAGPRPVTDAAVDRLGADLRQLARAAHLRALASGSGTDSLPDDVTFTYARLMADGGEERLDPSGEHLFSGDEVVVRIHNQGTRHRYVSAFDIGLLGAISPLTTTEPSGVGVAPGATYELFRLPGTHQLAGVQLFWPNDLHRGTPRPESFVCVVTDRPQDLSRLAQSGIGQRGAGGSALQRLLDDLVVGVRDARPADSGQARVRYRVTRFDFHLHPGARPGAEPAFDIDERPSASFRLVAPRAAGPVPDRVAVRLREVVVPRDRALLSAAVRIDSLVVTGAPPGDEPYRSATYRTDAVRDGERLPSDDMPLYEGPVRGFLDLALWVSPDDGKAPDLARLFRTEALSGEVGDATAFLAGLGEFPLRAATAADVMGAVAALMRTGAGLLERATGRSIGVFRTSLLPHERFGASDTAGRHPARELLKARDMWFSYEVVDVSGHTPERR